MRDHRPSGHQLDRPRRDVAEPAGARAQAVDVGVGAVGQQPSEHRADLGLDGGRSPGAVGYLDGATVVPDRRGGRGGEGGVEALAVERRLAGPARPGDQLAIGPGQLEGDRSDGGSGVRCGGGWLGFGDAEEAVEDPLEAGLLPLEVGDGLAVVGRSGAAQRGQRVVGLVEQVQQRSTPWPRLGLQASGGLVVGFAPGVGLDEGQEGRVPGHDGFGPDVGGGAQRLRRGRRGGVVGAVLVDDGRADRFVHWCGVCFLLGRGPSLRCALLVRSGRAPIRRRGVSPRSDSTRSSRAPPPARPSSGEGIGSPGGWPSRRHCVTRADRHEAQELRNSGEPARRSHCIGSEARNRTSGPRAPARSPERSLRSAGAAGWSTAGQAAVDRLNFRDARVAKTTVMPIAQAMEIHRAEPGSLPL